MFYPVDSLKRGGRFYLCWVADSWPLRFATITHRQLWSQDIRKICDDLIEVMTNESGRPANRFSLRLSSQLMRGLVRLYQRKVTVFLGDLCMINATVTKHVNKKWNIHEISVEHVQRRLPQMPPAQLVVLEEPEQEQRIEELIQNSGNVVGNIQDITLKESTFPQVQLPPNDGFGEENPEQALQMLQEQSLELMLAAHPGTSLHHSGLGPALDTSDKLHDKSHDRSDRSRLATHQAAMMERISEHDVTLFRKSTGEELTMGVLEKDIPEIPEVPLPELTEPPSKKQIAEEKTIEEIPVAEKLLQVEEPAAPAVPEKELVEIELEELEEPQAKRRRLKHKLIIDKKIKLSAEYLVARIENPHVDLRCEDSTDDIADLRLPTDMLFRRPCHSGPRLYQNIASALTMLYQRNLGVVNKQPLAEREMEEAITDRSRRVRTRSILERIEEEPIAVEPPQVHLDQPMPDAEVIGENILNVTEPQNITHPTGQVDISDLPTQKILLEETPSQSKKRVSEYDISSKRQRLIGYISFRESQQLALEVAVPITEADKENFPETNIIQPEENIREPLRDTNVLASRDTNIQPTNETAEKSLTALLQEAGLADLPPNPVEEQEVTIQTDTVQKTVRRGGSESSETPLGSLDRTKVSLGDSDQTTDSKRFIRDQWGTEGTMVKILGSIKARMKPLTVRKLISKGPVITGYKCIIAARCFTSILKLKQHGFIVIKKDPETLEIKDMHLGPKFDQIK